MSKTLLQITNDVLKRLREDAAINLTGDDYHNLLGHFVADIAQEVNETGPGWSALEHTINVAVASDQRVYDLSATVANSGDVDNADSPTNERSILLFNQTGAAQAWIYDNDTDDNGQPLTYVDPEDLERLYQRDRDNTQDKPRWFTLRKTTDFDGWQLELFPTPSAARHIRIRFYTPEAWLDPDTDEDTVIKVPNRVVFLGALYMALNERGEEIGQPGNIAERRYINALAAATEGEIRSRERAGYYDWERN